MGILGALADKVNIREDALRLLISILLGYPLAAIYRTFLYNKPVNIKHYYFIATGMLLYLFNFGFAIYHSLLSIFLAYLIVNFLPGSKYSVALAHICFLGHLLIGYWYAESDSHAITWTTPFCIMTLRFIGLVMDVYDGHQARNREEAERPESTFITIYRQPGLVEIAAYGLLFSGTLVGPQFPLKRFRTFVNNLQPVRGSSILPSIQRFIAGVFFAVLHGWGTSWVPDSYFNSREFIGPLEINKFKWGWDPKALPFLWKIFWNTIWFKATLYRYCAVWLLTEGAAILSGMAYNGNLNGNDRWDGVRDVHIIKFKLASDLPSVIEAFNCRTIHFARKHIFERIQKFGCQDKKRRTKYRDIYDHLLTLLFMAVWHGYPLSYGFLLLFGYMVWTAQEQAYAFIERGPRYVRFFSQWWMRPFTWLFAWHNLRTFMAFAFLTVGLDNSWQPLRSMEFYGYIVYFVLWPMFFYSHVEPHMRTKPPYISDFLLHFCRFMHWLINELPNFMHQFINELLLL